MSMHELGVIAGMNKIAKMGPDVNNAIRQLRARGHDDYARHVRVLAHPGEMTKVRENALGRLVDGLLARGEGRNVEKEMQYAISEAIDDNPSLDQKARNIFRKKNMRLQVRPTPARAMPSISTPKKPDKPPATVTPKPAPGSGKPPRTRVANVIGQQAVDRASRLPRWAKGLGLAAAFMGAGYGLSRATQD